MQSDKENVTNTPKVKEGKKRPSLQSPFSAASPNVRPAPRKIGRPFHELGDQNLDATSAADETFNMSSVKIGLSESLTETPSLTLAMSSTTRICYGDLTSEGSVLEHSEFREVVFQEGDRQQLVGDQNLVESAFGNTFTETDRTQATESSESLKENIPAPVYCDANLEETIVESTFCETDVTQETITHDAENEGDGTLASRHSANSTLTGAQLDEHNAVAVNCDANLEETSVETTFNDSQVTITNDITRNCNQFSTSEHSLNSTLTNDRIEKDMHTPVTCDSNLEETSEESTFCDSNVSQATVTDATAKEQQLIGATFTISADKGRSDCPVLSDANLEETITESTLFDVTQTTTTAGDETITNEFSEDVTPVHQACDANLEETHVDVIEAHTPNAKAPVGNSDSGSIRVFMDAKASPLTSGCEEVEQIQGLSLANELGELGMQLNRSSDVRITAAVNVSVVEETEVTSSDVCTSELSPTSASKSDPELERTSDAAAVSVSDSKERSSEPATSAVDSNSEFERSSEPSSAAKEDSDSSTERADRSLPMDATQYGDVSMDITTCSMPAEADDTLAFFEQLKRITPQHGQVPDSSSHCVGGEAEKCLSTQSNGTTASVDDSFSNIAEDTLSVVNLLAPPSASKLNVAAESENRERHVTPQELQPESDPREAFKRQTYQSKRPSDSRPNLSLSPIADLSRSDAGSRASTIRVPLDFVSDRSPTSSNRKYNMNDSEISFLMHENRIYDMALRNAIESPEELDHLKKSIADLENDKKELHEKLRIVTDELDAYRSGAASKNSEMADLTKKLNDMTKAKEHAERTVADYEFIVEDLKRRHGKQKEDLHAKVITLEEELENCRTYIRTQSEMTFTSTGLATELNLVREQLLIKENAQTAAEQRCEQLVKELEQRADENMKLLNQLGNVTEKSESLQKEIAELQRAVDISESTRKAEEERANNRCRELEAKLEEMDRAMEASTKSPFRKLFSKHKNEALFKPRTAVKSTEEVESVKNQLKVTMNDLNLLREIQTESELELMKLKDELCSATEDATKARLDAARFKDELDGARSEIKEKSDLLGKEQDKADEMSSKIAALEEQLEAEKLARDVTGRELEQLREENNITMDALKDAKSAISSVESRAEEMEKRLEEQKQHEEELKLRVSELQSVTVAHSAEKAMLEKEVSDGQAKVAELLEKLEQASESVTRLENEAVEHREEAKKLHAELLLGVQMYEGKVAEVEQSTKLLAELEEKMAQLRKTKDGLIEEIEIWKQNCEEKLADIEKLTTASAELKESIKALELERELLKGELAATNEKLIENEGALQAVESLKYEIVAVIAERDDLERRLSAAEEISRKCSEEAAQLSAASTELKESITALELEKVSLQDELVAANEKLVENERAQQAVESLKSEIVALTSERDDLEHRLSATEGASRKFSEEAAQIRELLAQSKAEVTALAAQKALLEEEFQVKENDYKRKLAASEKELQQTAELESAVEQLRSEGYQLSAELEEAKRKLASELSAKETKTISAMESEKFSLRSEMDILVAELKAAKQQHLDEVSAAYKIIDELKEQELKLRERIEAESAAKEKASEDCSKEIAELRNALSIKEAYAEDLAKECDKFDEIEAELREQIGRLCKERDQLKAQIDPSSVPVVPNLRAALTEGLKMLTPDHTRYENEGISKELEEKVEKLEREVSQLNMEKEQLERIANYSSCNEVGELKRYLAIKDDHIEYLGRQCDEFDALEEQYLKQIKELTEERDQLKAQIDPSSISDAPKVPILTEALKEGANVLSPDHPIANKQGSSVEIDRKVEELESLVERLQEEKKQLERQNSVQAEKISHQNSELLQRCEQQRKRIDELQRASSIDEMHELKSRIAELEEQNAALRSRSTSATKSKPKLFGAHGNKSYDIEEMEESAEKDGAFQSAPSSPTMTTKSFDSYAGPMFEESTVETAAVTPNRTLHTTLYKRLDKTTTLADTPESTKRENSRCAQQ